MGTERFSNLPKDLELGNGRTPSSVAKWAVSGIPALNT